MCLIGNFFATSLLVRFMSWAAATFIASKPTETWIRIFPVIYLFVIVLLVRLLLGIFKIYSTKMFVVASIESLVIVIFFSTVL